MKQLKNIPTFKSEKEEQKFWESADATEYVNFDQMEHWMFPNLKLSSKSVTIRIPETLLTQVKIKANQLEKASFSIRKGLSLAKTLSMPEVVQNFKELSERLENMKKQKGKVLLEDE